MIEPLIERSPQIASVVALKRPFADVADLSRTIEGALRDLDDMARIAFFRAHPELASDHPLAMTAESQAEQGRLNLTRAPTVAGQRIKEMNRRYREKFGFPFITAVVRHESIDSILNELEQRLTADLRDEMNSALDQIVIIIKARVANLFPTSLTPEARHNA